MIRSLAIEVLAVTALVLLAVIGVMVTDPDPVDAGDVEERVTALVEAAQIARVHRDLRAASWTPGRYRASAAEAFIVWAAIWAPIPARRWALPPAPAMGQPCELRAGVR